MKQFKYISNLSENDVENSIVIPCIDEQGNHTVLIKNSFKKTITTTFSTDNLIVQMDAILHLNNKDYFFHIISSNKSDMYSIGQFQIIYEYIFKKIDDPISGSELSALVVSLEDYFRTTPDADLFALQVGVFGELFTIKYLYDSGYKKIVEKYHQNFYSKHDIEIDQFNRIEIKTTVSEKRIHRFNHNQIYRNDINVYVASVMLEQSKEGISLYDLFQDVLSKYSNPDSIFALQKLMKRCNVGVENVGLRFSFEKAINDFKIYNSQNLPKIELDAPNGVTNIKYDVDCSLAENLNIISFLSIIEKL